jgi:hypothetical protein
LAVGAEAPSLLAGLIVDADEGLGLKRQPRKSSWPLPGFANSISGRASEYRNREKARAQNTQSEDAEGKSTGYGAEGLGCLT